jgi:hypothetical protein
MKRPWWYKIRRWLAGKSGRCPGVAPAQSRAYERAQTLVHAYYAALLYLAFGGIPAWDQISVPNEKGLLWPVAWLRETDSGMGARLVVSLYLGGALAAAVAPGRRWCRVLAALGLFQFTALQYSVGKIGHSSHLWVLTAGVLVFLPRLGNSPGWRERQSYLNVFWTAHALVLLTYSMSGLGKVVGAVWQAGLGERTFFHPQGMALHIAERLTETHTESSTGRWLVDHLWVSWPLMWGAVYLQFFAFWAIFRPALLRVWTVGLIVFHLATYFVLTIRFAPPVLLLALWGLASPFSPTQTGWKNIIGACPFLGAVGRLLRKEGSTPVLLKNAKNEGK